MLKTAKAICQAIANEENDPQKLVSVRCFQIVSVENGVQNNQDDWVYFFYR